MQSWGSLEDDQLHGRTIHVKSTRDYYVQVKFAIRERLKLKKAQKILNFSK